MKYNGTEKTVTEKTKISVEEFDLIKTKYIVFDRFSNFCKRGNFWSEIVGEDNFKKGKKSWKLIDIIAKMHYIINPKLTDEQIQNLWDHGFNFDTTYFIEKSINYIYQKDEDNDSIGRFKKVWKVIDLFIKNDTNNGNTHYIHLFFKLKEGED